MARHYGFLIHPCRPRTPEHKGKVENACQNDMFKFQTPDKARFIKLIISVSSMSELEISARLDRAIEVLAD